METISDYTILCTSEQTKKAIKLGAPIENVYYNVVTKEALERYNLVMIGGKEYKIPTAEQMIGWLEEQGITFDVLFIHETKVYKYYFRYKDYFKRRCKISTSRKEATLIAIDVALKYLTSKII